MSPYFETVLQFSIYSNIKSQPAGFFQQNSLWLRICVTQLIQPEAETSSKLCRAEKMFVKADFSLTINYVM